MTRVAVVTGAAGGIGGACVAAFMEAGWDVAGIGRGSRPDGLPGRWYGQIDLGVRAATGRLRDFFAEIGQIDALVNNAALELAKPLVDTTDEDWAAVQATNAAAPFVAIREAEPYLRASRGSVVNVSSVHAAATSTGVAAYAASKGALVALTRAAAVELGPSGIRVNVVLPGAIDTPMLRNAAAERLGPGSGSADPLADLAARTPLRRIGRPEEIAKLVVFLADAEQSGFITGAAIVADGGVLARLASE
ncbi:MAG TPA: SDR family oxidoreductase [Candidatus Limnocylindria bacterium]|nr:SDR family oxidoreductase [Candidatus Limnocylindria bacterium]